MQETLHHRGRQGRFKVIKTLGGSLMGRTLLVEENTTEENTAKENISGKNQTQKPATRTNISREIVLKELDLQRAEDWKEIELFERGAQTLKSLDHPQIPRFYDAFYGEPFIDETAKINDAAKIDETADVDENAKNKRTHPDKSSRFFLLQEFIDGEDLKQKLAQDGPFDETQIRAFLASMLDVLDYLHGFSPPVVHRDIKPSNIMQRPDGIFVLIDFDVVQTNAPDKIGGSTVVGTTGYMPPEQLVGRARPASDIFALGATAIHLACGVEPMALDFGADGFDFEAQSPLSPKLNRVLKQMTHPHISARLQNVDAVRRALDAAPKSYALALGASQKLTAYARQTQDNELLRVKFDRDADSPALEITLFARPTRLLARVVGMSALLILPAWLVLLSLTIPAWAGIILGALTPIFSYLIALQIFRRSDYDIGIKQVLTLTSDSVSLEEFNTPRILGHSGHSGRSGRSARRAPKSWSIAREDLRGVYLSVLDDEDLPGGQKLWRQALQNEAGETDGLIFEDHQQTRYIVGADLLAAINAPRFRQRLHALKVVADITRVYLDDSSSSFGEKNMHGPHEKHTSNNIKTNK